MIKKKLRKPSPSDGIDTIITYLDILLMAIDKISWMKNIGPAIRTETQYIAAKKKIDRLIKDIISEDPSMVEQTEASTREDFSVTRDFLIFSIWPESMIMKLKRIGTFGGLIRDLEPFYDIMNEIKTPLKK